MNQLGDIIFKRVDGMDYSEIRNNTPMFSVLLVIDGKRSVNAIAREDNYEPKELFPMVDQLEKMGMVVPVESGINRGYQETPMDVSFFKLPKKYRTGIVMVDNQHQRLVDMVTQLDTIRKTQYSSVQFKLGEVGQVVRQLTEYTISHFAFEESLMREANYEHYSAHKRIHELFITRVNEYKERFSTGEDIVDEIFEVLNRWLFNHILNDDLAFAPAVLKTVKTKGDSKGPWITKLLNKFFG